ncbi:PLP-dependent aminotransferase family protein [Lutibaculum baratangense]|uniref:Transcriptional regulator n=1 Tax=Lutibaculum baratangense AMV1 TaxID=631454 RepID=V4RUV0_9HYPH|nr:PLP-dependent aminotransferase family protein [Lutibaculum baratangense]ESR26845.1 Transcriptional regulator [Lutibaculum baratangense AMV1]
MSWFPHLPFSEGPVYLQIVAALENDIATGAVAPGQRLPTHREMASKLGLSVGTVSKAYAAAERRGLISGEVGRGTFVLRPTPELGVTEAASGGFRRINLALNAPPPTGEEAMIAAVLSEVSRSERLHDLLGYLPHQGLAEHRAAVADWISRHAMECDAGSVFITHGAQHAISIAVRLLARPGTPVIAENLTYSGMMALAAFEGVNLRGVTMDRHGLMPDRLDDAFRETGARVLYCTPTLQTATGSVMPEARRREIAEIVRRHEAFVVEDDAYGFLCREPVAPLASFLPERSFYVMSFAKCLAPGLRIGAMIAPPAFRDRSVNAIRSTGWMASPIMAEAVARLIRDGRLEQQVERKRAAAQARTDLARAVLGGVLDVMSDVPAFHVWMQMPAGRTATSLMSQAAHAGVTIVSPSALQPFDAMGNGMRLCLGGPESEADLESALRTIRRILDEVEVMSMV